MKILDHVSALEELCKATKKWGMYISIYVPDDIWDDVSKAAPYLVETDDGNSSAQLISDRSGFILFDTEKEMLDTYELTVGDDGPTDTNKYDGPVHVYALTCYPDGQTGNENT